MTPSRRSLLKTIPLAWGTLMLGAPPSPRAQTAANSPMIAAEVQRVDAAAGKITLKHEAIAHLDMPAMTMVFLVKDPSLLQDVQAGAKVRFSVDKQGGAYVVTALRKRDSD